jgi:hypothetical protein
LRQAAEQQSSLRCILAACCGRQQSSEAACVLVLVAAWAQLVGCGGLSRAHLAPGSGAWQAAPRKRHCVRVPV